MAESVNKLKDVDPEDLEIEDLDPDHQTGEINVKEIIDGIINAEAPEELVFDSYAGNYVLNRYLERFDKERKHNLIPVVGNPGDGKSVDAMTAAKLMDPTFNVEKRVYFNPLNLVNHMLNLYRKGELKVGMWWVFDEGEIYANNRSWWSSINEQLWFTAHVFRKLRQGLFITLPNLSDLDNKVRKVRTSIWIASKVVRDSDGDPKHGLVIPKICYQNSVNGNVSHAKYQHNGDNVDTIKIPSPSRSDLDLSTDLYDKKKDMFIFKTLGKNMLDKTVNEETMLEKQVKEALNRKDEFIVNGKVKRELIKFKIGVSTQKAKYIQSRLKQELNNDPEEKNQPNTNRLSESEKKIIKHYYKETEKSIGDIREITGRSKSTIHNAIKT